MDEILRSLNSKIIASNKVEDFVNQYKSLSTDEERVIHALNVMLKYNIIPQVCGDVKNAKESEVLREQGNKVFLSIPLESSSCAEALKLYTKSIAYAPFSSEQLALAYANRSAILIKIHMYKECINDIDRALALAYPDHLKVKLYVRKAECMGALKYPNIEETIKQAQYWLGCMSLNDANRKKLSDKLISIDTSDSISCNATKPKIRHKSESRLPKLKSHNPEVPCATGAVAIKYNTRFGRHVVATRKINAGEIIAIEKAYSMLLKPSNLYTHCSNCLKQSWSSIPCDYCTYAMYCSEECKAMEWINYHNVECAVFPSLIKLGFIKLDLLSLRLAVQAVKESNSIQELREELKEVDNCHDLRTKGFSKNGMFESDKYRTIFSLVTHTEKRTMQDLLRRSLDTCFILYFLATQTSMFGSPLNANLSELAKNSDVTFVGGLILRHQQMIPCNMHTTYDECESESIERGVVALPFFSLTNHSCNPNVLKYSRSRHTIIYAIQPIEEGDQIFNSYCKYYAITEKSERQKGLLEQFYFKCDCIPCTESWPVYSDLKSFRSLIETEETKKKVARALKKLNTYEDILMEGNVSDKPQIANELFRMLQVLYDNVRMPCQEISYIVEMIKRVQGFNGNRLEMPKL